MKKILLGMCLGATLSFHGVMAAESVVIAKSKLANPIELNSRQNCEKWLVSYYQNPEPQRVVEAFKCISTQGISDDERGLLSVSGFFSGVFKNNPQRLAGWMRDFQILSEKHQINDKHLYLVVMGLRYTGINDAKTVALPLTDKHPKLKNVFNAPPKNKPNATFEELPVDLGSEILGALWGKFFATGNSAPLERIMQVLPWADSPDTQEPNR